METKYQIFVKIKLTESEIDFLTKVFEKLSIFKKQMESKDKTNIKSIKQFNYDFQVAKKRNVLNSPLKIKYDFFSISDDLLTFEERTIEGNKVTDLDDVAKIISKEYYRFSEVKKTFEEYIKTFFERKKKLELELKDLEKMFINYEENETFYNIESMGTIWDGFSTPQKQNESIKQTANLKAPGHRDLIDALRIIAKTVGLVKWESVSPDKIPAILDILKNEYGIVPKSKNSVLTTLRRLDYVKPRI